MAQDKLTPQRLKTLKPHPHDVTELFDTVIHGLSLRMYPSGRGTWALRYRRRGGSERRRTKLGEYPAIGLTEARRRAMIAQGDVQGGGDPQGLLNARRVVPTLASLIERYLEELVKPYKKPRTYTLYSHYLNKLVAPRLGSKKANEVTSGMVDKLHRSLGEDTPVTANRVVVALSAVYTFAEKRELVTDLRNPARKVEKFKERSRERFLTTEDLARLGLALRTGEAEGLPWPDAPGRRSKHDRKPDDRKTVLSPHVTAAFRLLLFTGCRLREILHLRWSEIDFGRGLLLLGDSKTGQKTVVLNAPALQILTELPKIGEFVILGDDPKKPRADLKRPWELIRAHAGLRDVRVHDLRHTHASYGAGLGLGLPIIGKLLGHKHVDTTQKYAHLDADPLRQASNRIGSSLAAALNNADLPDNVRALR